MFSRVWARTRIDYFREKNVMVWLDFEAEIMWWFMRWFLGMGFYTICSLISRVLLPLISCDYWTHIWIAKFIWKYGKLLLESNFDSCGIIFGVEHVFMRFQYGTKVGQPPIFLFLVRWWGLVTRLMCCWEIILI